MANAGDLNADSIDDLAVGKMCAPAVSGVCGPGRIYAYLGRRTGLPATADVMFAGQHGGDAFGASVDGPGDTDGDGFDDLVVGASCAYGAGSAVCTGTVYVYDGTATGLVNPPTSFMGAAFDYFGGSVARAFVARWWPRG